MLYMCRRKQCGFIKEGRFWVKDVSSEARFRCPRCGTMWQPWKSHAELMPASRAVLLSREDNGASNIMLVASMDSSGDAFFSAMASARVAGALNPAALERHIIQVRFEVVNLEPEMRDFFKHMSDNNSSGRSWPVDHLEEGFIGAKLEWEDRYNDILISREAMPFVALMVFRAGVAAGAMQRPQIA